MHMLIKLTIFPSRLCMQTRLFLTSRHLIISDTKLFPEGAAAQQTTSDQYFFTAYIFFVNKDFEFETNVPIIIVIHSKCFVLPNFF